MMDILDAAAAFDRLAKVCMTIISVRDEAKDVAVTYVRRMPESTAHEIVGLGHLEAVFERQKQTLRSFVEAALRHPPTSIREVVALQNMLPFANAVLEPMDRDTARIAVAIGEALRSYAEKPSEAIQAAS